MKQPTLHALALGLLWPLAALAQSTTPSTPPPPAQLPVAAEVRLLPEPTPAPTPAPTSDAKPAPSLTKGEIRLNFQNAAFSDVLNYLSEAAGFIIIQDAPVTGTVNVVSKQPVSIDEAVDLLNSTLAEKGYAAIRNGRILKIVNRKDAQRLDIPVMSGSDPSQIPRKDEIVTQILPVRYVEAAKLVENLRPLLSADATLSANEASNAIILADTQTNIHRIAEIVHALDTSVASISAIRVFQLQYADSKSLATILTQLFATDQNSGRGNNNRGNNAPALPPWAAAFMGGGGRGGAAAGNTGGQSAAQQAATRVVAVADSQSNSVIVSAPEAAMVTIADIIKRIDTNVSDITETRIFWLLHADATDLSNVINSLYADAGTTPGGKPGQQKQQPAPQTTVNRTDRALLQSRVVAVPEVRNNALIISAARESMSQIADIITRIDTDVSDITETRIFRLQHADAGELSGVVSSIYSNAGASTNGGSQQKSQQSGGQNTWAAQQTSVVAVADPRTNSLIVTAARESMPQIASTIERLDSGDSRKQKVYIYSLENADPDNVATILRGMFSSQGGASTTGAQPASNALNKRTVNGASSDISNVLNTSNSSSRTR